MLAMLATVDVPCIAVNSEALRRCALDPSARNCSADGREIVFDRTQENSDLAPIDLARR